MSRSCGRGGVMRRSSGGLGGFGWVYWPSRGVVVVRLVRGGGGFVPVRLLLAAGGRFKGGMGGVAPHGDHRGRLGGLLLVFG